MKKVILGGLAVGAVVVGIVAAPIANATPTNTDDIYYPNCAAAPKVGAAPIYKWQPGYRPGLDRDGDGIACE